MHTLTFWTIHYPFSLRIVVAYGFLIISLYIIFLVFPTLAMMCLFKNVDNYYAIYYLLCCLVTKN